MKKLAAIEQTAELILAGDPDPVVRLRVLRDVLGVAPDDPAVLRAKRNLKGSRWVREVDREQWYDGSWGRFHSQDTKAKQKISTTEVGVDRALALGLDLRHPVVRKAAGYVTQVLQSKKTWRDWVEKSPAWDSAVKVISGGTLAKVQPDHAALDKIWEFWAAIAQAAFASGDYDAEAAARAAEELSSSPAKTVWLRFGTKYHIALLGSRAAGLPRKMESALVDWIWGLETGIGYLEAPLSRHPDRLRKFRLDAWFSSLELLSMFPSWRRYAKDAVEWLWEHRTDEGLWDFGARSSWSFYFPLSESWRKKNARRHDWSTRALALLRKYCGR